MKRRSLLWTVLAGVLGTIGLTVFVSLSTDSDVVAVSHPVLPGAERSPPRLQMPLPEDPTPRVLPLPAAMPEVEETVEAAAAEPEIEDHGTFEELVLRLEEIEERRPLDFHHGAVSELEPFLGMSEEEREVSESLDEAMTILDEWTLSPRVHGVLLALVGAWGEQSEVLARCTDRGESWRSTVIGLLCTDSAAGEPSGLTLELTEFLSKTARSDIKLLPLELGRIPDAALHAELSSEASQLVDDMDAWHSRTLAVLALGSSIDERSDTLDLMTRLLFDDTPWGMQVRLPVCFVMAHARSDAAREVLLQFLEDPQTANGGKDMVRWWMGDRPALPRELEVLTAPLRDPSADRMDKFTAVGSLLKRGGLTNPEEDAVIVATLIEALRTETDEVLELAMVSTLAKYPGGSERLRVLENSLRTSPRAVVRLWAAKGLGTVLPGYESQARSILISVRPDEEDSQVLAAIEESLRSLE